MAALAAGSGCARLESTRCCQSGSAREPLRSADEPARPDDYVPGSAGEGLASVSASQVSAGRQSLDESTEEQLPTPRESVRETIALNDVAVSIHDTFPLVEAAYQERQIAAGRQMASWGAFDTKFKAGTESGPFGFYETYRHGVGLLRPMYNGSDVFGGYRVGRGSFQPWYQERQTDDGGEFKAGIIIPLARNRQIDARRAQVWRAQYDRQRAEPEIQAKLILFVRDGSLAYWQWIAAGRKYEIGERALKLAQERNAKLKRKVEEGDIEPPVLQDNLRAIAKREAKLVALRRKLRQSALKLSLFYREADGTPIVPADTQLVEFPKPAETTDVDIENEVATALVNRPELAILDAQIGRLTVDLAQARNNSLPAVNARFVGSQDMGTPTSKKRDKSQFELEAGIYIDVPLQRRKARGKFLAANGKFTQIAAKRRFTEDKIQAEIKAVYVAIAAAFERLGKARESKRLADYMADVERRKFELGQSNLLSVVLREQYAIEAAEAEVDALLESFSARAILNAAMARDQP